MTDNIRFPDPSRNIPGSNAPNTGPRRPSEDPSRRPFVDAGQAAAGYKGDAARDIFEMAGDTTEIASTNLIDTLPKEFVNSLSPDVRARLERGEFKTVGEVITAEVGRGGKFTPPITPPF